MSGYASGLLIRYFEFFLVAHLESRRLDLCQLRFGKSFRFWSYGFVRVDFHYTEGGTSYVLNFSRVH